MRSPSLTRKTNHRNGHLVSTYSWNGRQVDVFDSARNGILVIELFHDEELQPDDKAQLLVRMLFPDPLGTASMAGEGLGELLIHIVWEAFGLDISADGRHASEHEAAVFDFEEDAARIRASLLQCFGIDWEEASRFLSYADMCSLLGMLLEADTETPFQQAVYYRTAKPPKRTKHNADICDAFAARAKHFALGKTEDAAKSANDTAAGMFAAMKHAAQKGA